MYVIPLTHKILLGYCLEEMEDFVLKWIFFVVVFVVRENSVFTTQLARRQTQKMFVLHYLNAPLSL